MNKFKDGDWVIPKERARKAFKGNNFGTGVGRICMPANELHWRQDYQYRVEWVEGRPAWYNNEHLDFYKISLENK